MSRELTRFIWVCLLSAGAPRLAGADSICSPGVLKGSFGFTGYGIVPRQLGGGGIKYDPISEVGLAQYDGAGNASLEMTILFHGKLKDVKVTGSSTISADCRGTTTWVDDKGTKIGLWIWVAVNGLTHLSTLATAPGSFSGGTYSVTFEQSKL